MRQSFAANMPIVRMRDLLGATILAERKTKSMSESELAERVVQGVPLSPKLAQAILGSAYPSFIMFHAPAMR